MSSQAERHGMNKQLFAVYGRAENKPAAVLKATSGEDAVAAWATVTHASREQFQGIALDDALHATGRSLYGPTFRGFQWYDRAKNEALLAAAGEGGRYEPHADACSGAYLTVEAAGLAALRG